MLALLLVACGSSSDEGTAVDQPADETPAGEEALPKKKWPSRLRIEMARFFGDCDDTTAGVTDVKQATSECEVVQILTNKFNAENDKRHYG